ncbi:MAG TPA: excinuclease ABC subunit B, partial [Candidatus Wirthbacteria bacterium]|nr:excinuclease ABC subunit B [Candidatus Wirthbacteria bacterium]
HSDVKTLERVDILRDLRLGHYDVLVGINLLREGLDLPEVSLVAILDADKQGFLRSQTALIQTIGRAARHVEGKVIMYASKITAAMKAAIDETERRRNIQLEYNKKNNITPQSIQKAIRDDLYGTGYVHDEDKSPVLVPEKMTKQDALILIKELEKQMQKAASRLEFEEAALLRDQIEKIQAKFK